ncbi:terminase small subunit [uncultured Paraglaciecola sp.]|uniref:terminase small subunit n=1 Tax=uncultured Paraglaciecola sp. TaxID=1765024 RepID=UPI00261A9BAA|nr:terminase small subunit [uncultured Paraglaciecola sp.]
MALNVRQKRFCEEYIVDLNATQAAIRAGYSKRTAGVQAHDLLKKPEIQAIISTLQDDRSKRTQITADRVLEELGKIGFADIRKAFGDQNTVLLPGDMDDDIAGALVGMEVTTRPSGEYDENDRPIMENVHKFRLADKVRGLELLGRHLLLFKDRVVHEGEVIVKDLRGVKRDRD